MEYLNIKSQADLAVKLPKLLIISSYHRACGIAQYVEFLELPLRQQTDFDIEIASLPVDLLRSQSPYAKRAARIEFNAILQKVERADVINIQFEPGLLGFTPSQIWSNLNAILCKSKKVIITYHTVPPLDGPRFHFSRRGMIDFLRASRSNFVFDRLFAKIRKTPGKFHHIVQTAREAKNFALLGVQKNTITHQPLAFISKGVREQMDHDDAKSKILAHMNISGDAKLLGCFGFLSPYKGIEIAIRALSALPKDHHLLVIGGLHPEGIDKGRVEAPYIQKLLKVVKKHRGLNKRVHFCGALDNEYFNQVMLACDAVVLPYAEVGQTSSGPAALALDMGRPLYCSHTKCFSELDRYQPGAVSFFEIGNHMELAEKLLLADGDSPSRINARTNYLKRFSVEHRSASYIAAAKQLIKES
ncbi:glycosyltransferase [Pseudomonas fluorescens]|uniref:Glycosyltransferase n=1 Tax=Pseudomonas fluorescens TaxID=294 RepID=A0A944DMV8_PSEFL|nr:glycosyltransferase [Pseudomonas fluorescens]MBT2297846.1 glycosyltransferase [Pseudomonas fluorescens]MBT2308137.1 glycosyltransferase [Pseudomonas fluorescens]MBT2315073.1 glycosyltransferase [Pseudomonas fluorescens]MBT2320619.1 glycosyltransferase [Pseudomonas fluorescens]MBT2328760.1 glycosyltransferase [Pseudomonas fluorescens]